MKTPLPKTLLPALMITVALASPPAGDVLLGPAFQPSGNPLFERIVLARLRGGERGFITAAPAADLLPAALSSVSAAEDPAVRPELPAALSHAPTIFAEEGVPPQLIWVAEVESSFNPRARSRAGAAGLFQLMPITARELGLRVGRGIDQRFDTALNTRAAARYLRRLHDRFGSWSLALAAYNAGPTRVARLLRRYRTHEYAAIARHLPAETQHYVPAVLDAIRRNELGIGHDRYAAATDASAASGS